MSQNPLRLRVLLLLFFFKINKVRNSFVKKNLGHQKIFGLKQFLVHNILGAKNVAKNNLREKVCYPKRFMLQKRLLVLKKIWVKI